MRNAIAELVDNVTRAFLKNIWQLHYPIPTLEVVFFEEPAYASVSMDLRQKAVAMHKKLGSYNAVATLLGRKSSTAPTSKKSVRTGLPK